MLKCASQQNLPPREAKLKSLQKALPRREGSGEQQALHPGRCSGMKEKILRINP
jgi:hypothetical protein